MLQWLQGWRKTHNCTLPYCTVIPQMPDNVGQCTPKCFVSGQGAMVQVVAGVEKNTQHPALVHGHHRCPTRLLAASSSRSQWHPIS